MSPKSCIDNTQGIIHSEANSAMPLQYTKEKQAEESDREEKVGN